MRVITDHARTYPEDPARYFDFTRFAGQTAGDFAFFAGHFDFKALDALPPDERAVYLELEEPNRFLVPESATDFHHLDRDERFANVLTLCPFTAEWLNRRGETDRWTPAFFPFNERHTPAPCAKEFDVIYTGGVHAAGIDRLIRDLAPFRHRFVSQLRHPAVTDFNCSYQEKLSLIARSRVTLVHNQLFVTRQQIENVARHAHWRENTAFSQLPLPGSAELLAAAPDQTWPAPQLKSRLFGAAFCRSLILCQRDPWNLVERYFEPGTEFVYFEPDRLQDILRAILADYPRYAAIAERAHQRAVREYSTTAFFEKFLRDLHPAPASKPRWKPTGGGSAERSFLAQLQQAHLWQPGAPLRLHLGCGEQRFDGYVNVDFPPAEHTVQTSVAADIFADIIRLDLPAASVDEVRLHHVFEHFDRPTALALLCRWQRWLKPGGRLTIETPDAEASARLLTEPQPSFAQKQVVLRHLFGSHEAAWAVHYDGWYPAKYQRVLGALGFGEVHCQLGEWQMTRNVTATAVKVVMRSPGELATAVADILRENLVDASASETRLHSIWMEKFTQLHGALTISNSQCQSAECEPNATRRAFSLPRRRGEGGRRPDEGWEVPTPPHVTPHPNPLPSSEEASGSRTAAVCAAPVATATTLSARPPLVSIFIPAYNREHYLPTTLDSLLAQTFGDFEILLADDGSTDRTLAIARDYAQRDPRIRVLALSHRGEVAARNEAVMAAHPGSRYLLNHDSDDLSLPDKLAKLVAHLETHADIAAIGCFAEYFDDTGKSLGCPPLEHEPARIRATFGKLNSMVNSAALIRRAVFEQVGPYREAFRSVDDYDFFARALLAGFELANLPEVLHRIRLHPASVGSTRAQQQEELAAIIRADYQAGQVASRATTPEARTPRRAGGSTRLNLLHTVEFYAPHTGGAELVVQQLSERLARRGHRVTVATTKLPDRAFRELNGVGIVEFAVSGKLAEGVNGEFARYQQFLREFNCDVMMNYAAQQWATDLAMPLLQELRPRRANVLAPCGYSALADAGTLRWPQFRAYFQDFLPAVLPLYDAAVYHSATYQDFAFGERLGLKNGLVIPNGTDTDEFTRPLAVNFREKYRLTTRHFGLCVANFMPGKGQERVLETVRRMARPDFTMVFIGHDGGTLAALRAQAAGLNVRFLTGVPREDVVAAFRSADVFLFGSHVEASPLVIIEAKAARLPFVSTDCGNVREWQGGVVCAPDDMAAQASHLLDNESLRVQLAEAGHREWKEKLTWDSVVDRWEELYLRLAHARTRAGDLQSPSVASPATSGCCNAPSPVAVAPTAGDCKSSAQPLEPAAITAVIFSKDRALQLDATIRSFYRHCRDAGRAKLRVLHCASDTAHRVQYAALTREYPAAEFIAEQRFKTDLLQSIAGADQVLFLVDDNLFVRDFTLAELSAQLAIEPRAVGHSLRLGRNTTYCYPLNRAQALPTFAEPGAATLAFAWPGADCDFAYPLEVSSSLYRLADLRPLLESLDFNNPNTLEARLAESAPRFRESHPLLLCVPQSLTFCAPVNKVQADFNNRAGARNELSPATLARLFAEGQRVNVAAYDGFTPNACHQEVELLLVAKSACPPLVSVVIPCFKQAHLLPEAVASVLAQTHAEWEIIIVNDGSPDDTSAVAERLIRENPSHRIHLLNQPNQGLAMARNNGIALALGKHILPLDADDGLAPDFLAKTVAVLEANPDTHIVFTDLLRFGDADGVFQTGEFSLAKLATLNQLNYCSLYRREVFDAVGGYNPNLVWGYEDWDFWIGAAERGFKARKIAEPLFRYRIKAGSMLTTAAKRDAELRARIVLNHPKTYDAASHEWASQVWARVAPEAEAQRPAVFVSEHIARAETHFSQGNLPGARDALRQAVALLPESGELREALGSVLFQLGELEPARVEFVLAVRHKPRSAAAHLKLATTAVQLGRVEEFEAALARALELEPENLDALRLLARLNREAGRWADAAKVFGRILQQSPDCVDTLLGLAFCLQHAGDRETARLVIARALELEPDNAIAKENLAVLCGGGNDRAEAVETAAASPAHSTGLKPGADERVEESALRAAQGSAVPASPPREAAATPDRTLRVTYLIESILGVTGGNQTLLRQAEELRRKGHDVTIVTRTEKPDWFQFQVRVVRVPEGQGMATSVPPSDVVVSTYFTNTHELKAVTAPVKVYYAQGDQYVFADATLPDTEQHRLLRELSGLSYQAPGVRFVANSHNLARAVERTTGRKADAILPVCTDQTVFRPLSRALPGSKLRLLIVGPDSRGTREEPLTFKGIQEIHDALTLLAKRCPHFTAVRISGTGPEIFAKFPCEFHVAPADELKTFLFGTADILIYASHYDSCPRPPQEAMAAGAAVVCTDTPGAREYCREGVNCLLVPVGSPEAIAEAVEKLMRDRSLRERLVQGGLATAKDFPREREWDEWEKLLLAFAGEGQRAAPAPAPAPFITDVARGGDTASGSLPTFQLKLPPVGRVGDLTVARAALQRGQHFAAWTETLMALEARPFHPEAWLLLAETAQAAGDVAMARECAARARQLVPHWRAAKRFHKALQSRGRVSNVRWPALPAKAGQPRLTIFVIAKNEEKFLGQCLDSVRGLADQLIVVDTGSTDSTVEIAKMRGAEVYSHPWEDDFSAARNAALAHATGDWVMFLDADEELPACEHAKLRADMAAADVLAVRLRLQNVGQEEDGQCYVPRLWRNAPGLFFYGRVHEQVFPSILVKCEAWGMETRLGTATLRHHGYSAEVIADRNKIERNLRLLRRAIEELPGEPMLLMNMGLELVRSGQLREGLEHYRSAFSQLAGLPKKDVVPELREALLTQYVCHLHTAKEFAEVLRVVESPLAQQGGLTASIHFMAGLAALELKQFSDGAGQMHQCLAKRDEPTLSPVNRDIRKAGPHHVLALCRWGAGQHAETEKAFLAALAEDAGARAARFDFARWLGERGRVVDALQTLHAMVGDAAQEPHVWLLGGQLALSRPEFIEFAADWTGEAVAHFPEHNGVLVQRAEALMLSQQSSEALALLRRSSQRGNAIHESARLLLELVEGTETASFAAGEAAVSREFVRWYRRLISFSAGELLATINERLEALRPHLPTAARVLSEAMEEAGQPVAA
ncbi:MAG: glycosyltransferase [Verrucomicrobia bacterium]|nr:glycosyltransferase [Verrucomicrobiota bacterium]